MSGDALLLAPDMLSTRAISIDAADIWPWLVQMGSGRGGAYTYDWIENLFGLDMHSANEILPQFQRIAVGDVLPVGANGPGMRVEVVEINHALTFRSVDGNLVMERRMLIGIRERAEARVSGRGAVRQVRCDDGRGPVTAPSGTTSAVGAGRRTNWRQGRM
jgi:hypothetical protein